MEIAQHTQIFLKVCLLGFSLGLFYDFFRILRIAFKTCNVIIWIEDIIFFLIVTFTSFTFLILKNEGQFRGFLVIGEILGGILYFNTLSIVIMRIANKIIKIIKNFMIFVNKKIIQPIIYISAKFFKHFVLERKLTRKSNVDKL